MFIIVTCLMDSPSCLSTCGSLQHPSVSLSKANLTTSISFLSNLRSGDLVSFTLSASTIINQQSYHNNRKIQIWRAKMPYKTLSVLRANSADDILMIFFSNFSWKAELDISCKLSPCMKCWILCGRAGIQTWEPRICSQTGYQLHYGAQLLSTALWSPAL